MAEVTPIDPAIYKIIVGSLPQAIALLNEKREILSCNEIFQSLFNLSGIPSCTKKIEDILPDKDLGKLIDEVQAEGSAREMELLFEDDKGERKILKTLIKKIPLKVEEGDAILLVTFEDISEKMRAEVEKVHSENLENMVQIARCLAHEMGNSLYAINSTLQFIKEERVPEKGADIASEIDFLIENVQGMTHLLTSMFEFNYSGRFQFREGDVHGVIKKTIALLGKEATKRNIMINTDFSCEIPFFWMDKRQLEHLFLNLLKNGMESIAGGGRIWIKTSFRPVLSEEREGFVTIDIGDTGEGIAEEDLKYLFKPFFSTKKEGHGLGLYICQQIVERHKGRLTVKSEKGKGSIFTIILPVLYLSPG